MMFVAFLANPFLAPLSLCSRRWLKRWRTQNVLTKWEWLKSEFILCDLLSLDQLHNHVFEDSQKQMEPSRLNTISDDSGGQSSADWVGRFKSCETRFMSQLTELTSDYRKYTRQKFTSSQILFHVWEIIRWHSKGPCPRKDGKDISSTTKTSQR